MDTSLFTGDITYISASENSGSVYWQIPLDGAIINGATVDTTRKNGAKPLAVIDTGTTVALGARKAVAAIYAQVPGASIDSDVTFNMLGYDTDVYTFPCSNLSMLPQLDLVFGGVPFSIYPPDLVLQLSSSGTTCTGSLVGMDRWVLVAKPSHQVWRPEDQK